MKKLVFEFEGDWANWRVYETEPDKFGNCFWVEGGCEFSTGSLEDAVQELKEADFDQYCKEY